MVLAGSTSAGSLMWSARAAPGRASITAARSRRVRMDRPSTDFLAYFSEELRETSGANRTLLPAISMPNRRRRCGDEKGTGDQHADPVVGLPRWRRGL